MSLGWVLASATTEGAVVDNYWDGDEWQATLAAGLFFGETAGVTVEQMRASEGDFQRRYTDRDVRMLRAEQAISLVP